MPIDGSKRRESMPGPRESLSQELLWNGIDTVTWESIPKLIISTSALIAEQNILV